MAAHITAAAPGGPRYDPALAPEERRAYGNGIWLCANDGAEVDGDARRYPPELLVQWRQTAEALAREARGKPAGRPPADERRLMVLSRGIEVAGAGLREAVDEFLRDVGAGEAWGGHYDLARMALYELALNASRHGRASSLELIAEDHLVCLRDDGAAFGPRQLRAGGRGGHRAILDLERHAAGDFSLRWRTEPGVNQWMLVDDVATGGVGVPCSLVLETAPQAARQLQVLWDCEEIHVYVSHLASYSDIYAVLHVVAGDKDARLLVFHGLSPASHLRAVITERLPSARFSP